MAMAIVTVPNGWPCTLIGIMDYKLISIILLVCCKYNYCLQKRERVGQHLNWENFNCVPENCHLVNSVNWAEFWQKILTAIKLNKINYLLRQSNKVAQQTPISGLGSIGL